MGRFSVTIFKKVVGVLGISAISLFSSLSFAGGDNYSIKINQIQTLAKHKHIIYLEKLSPEPSLQNEFSGCKDIKITVDYKFKENKIRQFLLYIQLLFGANSEFHQGVKQLNDKIVKLNHQLTQNPNIIYETDDVEAFYPDKNNKCHFYSKTLEVYDDKEAYIQFFVR